MCHYLQVVERVLAAGSPFTLVIMCNVALDSPDSLDSKLTDHEGYKGMLYLGQHTALQ